MDTGTLTSFGEQIQRARGQHCIIHPTSLRGPLEHSSSMKDVDILIFDTHPKRGAAMSLDHNGIEAGVGRFGPQAAAGTPPRTADTDATVRLPSIAQTHDQRTRGRRTRRTVDLSPTTHRALDIWQREAADRLRVARVTGQEVLSALIEQLLNDPKLSAQITRRIHDRR